MTRLTATILLLCQFAPVALCAEQGTTVNRTPDYWLAYASRLPAGAPVRIRTADGRRVTAILTLVEQDSITIEPRTRIPEPPRRIRFADIQQLELSQSGISLAKAAAVGAGVGAGVFLGLLMIVAAGWD